MAQLASCNNFSITITINNYTLRPSIDNWVHATTVHKLSFLFKLPLTPLHILWTHFKQRVHRIELQTTYGHLARLSTCRLLHPPIIIVVLVIPSREITRSSADGDKPMRGLQRSVKVTKQCIGVQNFFYLFCTDNCTVASYSSKVSCKLY